MWGKAFPLASARKRSSAHPLHLGASPLKPHRAFDGNWSVMTSHSGSPLPRTVSSQIESVDFSSARFSW